MGAVLFLKMYPLQARMTHAQTVKSGLKLHPLAGPVAPAASATAAVVATAAATATVTTTTAVAVVTQLVLAMSHVYHFKAKQITDAMSLVAQPRNQTPNC